MFGKAMAVLLSAVEWALVQAFFGVWFGGLIAIVAFPGGLLANLDQKLGVVLGSVLLTMLISTTGFAILRRSRRLLAAAERDWASATALDASIGQRIASRRWLTFYVPLTFAACGLLYGFLAFLFLKVTRPGPFLSLDVLATQPEVAIGFGLGAGMFFGFRIATLFSWEAADNSRMDVGATPTPVAALHVQAPRHWANTLARLVAAVAITLILTSIVMATLLAMVALPIRYLASLFGAARPLTWGEISELALKIVSIPVHYWWAVLLIMTLMVGALAWEVFRAKAK